MRNFLLLLFSLFASAGFAECSRVALPNGSKPTVCSLTFYEATSLEERLQLFPQLSNVNMTDEDGVTPIHYAVGYGKPKDVTALIDAGANLNVIDHSGRSLWQELFFGAWGGIDLEKMRILIDAGIDVSYVDGDGRNPIMMLPKTNNFVAAVNMLIEAGVDAKHVDNRNNTTLHNASWCGKATKVLLSNGADPQLKNDNGSTPIHKVAVRGRFLREIEASECGTLDLSLASFQEQRVNFAAKDEKGRTALHLAAWGDWDHFYSFYSYNPSGYQETDTQGQTLLHYAAYAGRVKTVEWLIPLVGVDVRSLSGATPLHSAARNGSKEVVEILINAGAKISTRDINGDTPLHWAARSTESKSILALIENGAKVSLKNAHGETVWDVAQKNEKLRNSEELWVINDARYD